MIQGLCAWGPWRTRALWHSKETARVTEQRSAQLGEVGEAAITRITQGGDSAQSSPPFQELLQMLHGLGTRPDKSTEKNP